MQDVYYKHCVEQVRSLIPSDEFCSVLDQDGIDELDSSFLGFVDLYCAASLMIPTSKIIIDFGCNLAAQSYLFKDHRQYIGVDVVDMKRFTPSNATHYVMSIQDWLDKEAPTFLAQHKPTDVVAICSYVPDFQATSLVKAYFQNVICYYP